MKILALESSAVSAGVALCEDGRILGEYFINNKHTHSTTLMPMVESMLSTLGIKPSDIDVFAVSSGPGSFTGLRIGIGTIKGLAWSLGKPCIGVSTLEAMAYSAASVEGILCAVMDAKCSQVYNAVFEIANGTVIRLTPDRATGVTELLKETEKYNKCIYLIGDGAKICYNNKNERQDIKLLPENMIFQRASGVALLAYSYAQNGKFTDAAKLSPVYLRLPQAERELLKKQGG